MSSFSDDTKQSWASSAVAGTPGVQKERATGVASLTSRWDVVRRQIAKTFIADPDCVFYQLYLGSNRAFGLATELSRLIDGMLPYVEGAMFESKPAATLPTVPAHVQGGASIESVAEYQTALAKRANAAAATTRVGTRLAERGVEAQGKYRQLLAEFLPKYFDLQSSISLLSDCAPDFEPLRKLAVENAVEKATAASNAPYGAGQAAKFTLQTAAAASLLLVTNRVPSISLRASYRQKCAPDGVEFSLSGSTITWSTGSPALCYIKAGDVVSWAGGTTTISAVAPTTVTLATAISAESYDIIPSQYELLRTFQEAGAEFLKNAPDVDNALKGVLTDFSSVTTIKTILRTLGQIQSDLSGISAAAQAVLVRTGTTGAVVRTPLTTTLKAYNPVVSSQTKESCKKCKTLLDDESFGFSSTRFLQGDLVFLTRPVAEQRAATYFQTLTGGL